jgi:hypothetical protein
MRSRPTLIAGLALLLTAWGPAVAPTSFGSTREHASAVRAADTNPDFNGDGFADLAVGVETESLGAQYQGAVNVVYGSSVGLAASGNQLWSQDTPGIRDQGEQQDYFGHAIVGGDFNGDGFSDLAVGVPYEEDEGILFLVGAVNVIYGSASGLTSSGNQLWTQDSPGIKDARETNDMFGNSLAAGDLNGDGFADLAVGVPGEAFDGLTSVGAVNVIYGSASGLTAVGNQLWTQDSPGILDSAEDSDSFGWAVAIGDFDGDGFGDLVVGVPTEDLGNPLCGAINVIYGSSMGLAPEGNQFWAQGMDGILDHGEYQDEFGAAVAAGDMNGDGFTDVAVGEWGENIGAVADAGAVNVIYGSSGGLSATGNQFWHQDSPGILDQADVDDSFGSSVTVADANGDGFADLVAGVPYEAFPLGKNSAGAVNVIYGSSGGLSSTGNQFWDQDSSGILDKAESGDTFGYAVGASDYDGDGFTDLAVGVWQEGVGEVPSAGAVNVLYGSAGSLTANGNQAWTQNSPGILDQAEELDQFGAALG